MCQLSRIPSAASIVHGHTSLLGRVEPLESQTRRLCEARARIDEGREPFLLLLRDLQVTSNALKEDLLGYILEEEELVFPMYRHLMTPEARFTLQELKRQHRKLAELIEHFTETLRAIEASDDLPSHLFELLHTRGRILHYSMTIHITLEREFFDEIARVSEARCRESRTFGPETR
jgi:iron-sulfur cluster repair protein YtfE (RIC family)